MKNSLKYLRLWQKKRSELQIADDLQTGWDQMEGLLDQHMPAANKSSGFKGFRMLPALFITFSAAAMIYVASNVRTLEKHKHRIERKFHKGNPMRPGTIFKDSAEVKDSAVSNNSLAIAKQRTSSPDSGNKRPGRGGESPLSNLKNGGSLKSAGQHGGRLANPPLKGSTPANGKGPFAVRANGRRLPKPGDHHNPGYTNQTKKRENQIAGNLEQTNATIAADDFNGRHNVARLVVTTRSISADLFANKNSLHLAPLPGFINNIFQKLARANAVTTKNKKNKSTKTAHANPSNIDWGLLLGVNTSGSFTAKSQNSNFYGSSPIDAYLGLFATFKINNSWAINPQVRLFSPQLIATTYSHANQSRVDSGQSLTITASRKMYAVNVPVYLVYNAGNGISFKAGPVINFPVKQINANSTLQPDSIRSDTTYYTKVMSILKDTQYQQKINFGFSAGAAFQFKRWIFEATYLKSLSGYKVSNDLGTYKSNNGTLQFTIGFQLDKMKP